MLSVFWRGKSEHIADFADEVKTDRYDKVEHT